MNFTAKYIDLTCLYFLWRILFDFQYRSFLSKKSQDQMLDSFMQWRYWKRPPWKVRTVREKKKKKNLGHYTKTSSLHTCCSYRLCLRTFFYQRANSRIHCFVCLILQGLQYNSTVLIGTGESRFLSMLNSLGGGGLIE